MAIFPVAPAEDDVCECVALADAAFEETVAEATPADTDFVDGTFDGAAFCEGALFREGVLCFGVDLSLITYFQLQNMKRTN